MTFEKLELYHLRLFLREEQQFQLAYRTRERAKDNFDALCKHLRNEPTVIQMLLIDEFGSEVMFRPEDLRQVLLASPRDEADAAITAQLINHEKTDELNRKIKSQPRVIRPN